MDKTNKVSKSGAKCRRLRLHLEVDLHLDSLCNFNLKSVD
jgi:hypothetical protein